MAVDDEADKEAIRVVEEETKMTWIVAQKTNINKMFGFMLVPVIMIVMYGVLMEMVVVDK